MTTEPVSIKERFISHYGNARGPLIHDLYVAVVNGDKGYYNDYAPREIYAWVDKICGAAIALSNDLPAQDGKN